MLSKRYIEDRLDEIESIKRALPDNEQSKLYIEQLNRLKKAYEKLDGMEVIYGNTI